VNPCLICRPNKLLNFEVSLTVLFGLFQTAFSLFFIIIDLQMNPGWDLKRWQKMVLTMDSPVTKSKDLTWPKQSKNLIETWEELGI